MCNINKKSKLKAVTIYKAVYKHNGKYYSYFAGVEIKIGKAQKQTQKILETNSRLMPFVWLQSYDIQNDLYNKNMIGKCSGFKSAKYPKRLFSEWDGSRACILKIELEGEIMIGDATKVADEIPNSAVTYAGTIIKSFKEI